MGAGYDRFMEDRDDAMLPLPAEPTAAAMARAFVRRRWSDVDDSDTMDAVALCVSELVTNALDHAPPPYEMRIARDEGRLRIEVADASSHPPLVRPSSPMAARGRGMFLVDATASQWGVESTPRGKTVWAEFPAR